jgi:hypothetical protein
LIVWFLPLTMSAADDTVSTPRNLRVVWIQLYVGDQHAGYATKICCKRDLDIDEFAKLVKEIYPELKDISFARLAVYRPGTPLDALNVDALLRRGGPVPNGTTDEQPLMVMAPAMPLNGATIDDISSRMLSQLLIDSAPLGSDIHPIRKGSKATEGDFKELIVGEELSNGIKLTHVFLRSFLENFHSKANAELEVPTHFDEWYTAIWSPDDPESPINVNHKNANGQTQETVVTAFEGSLFSSTISLIWNKLLGTLQSPDINFPPPLWISELEIRFKGDHAKPRCDGALCAIDPILGHARSLVTMENKLKTFVPAGRYEAQSNACDLMAKKPMGASPWPMLILLLISTEAGPCMQCQALVPVSKTTLKKVKLVETGASVKDLYRWLDAVTRATFNFLVELKTEKKELPFGSSEKNVALCPLSNCYFKYYYQSTHRKPNIALIRQFIDINAALIDDGDGKPIFVRMKNVGKAWPWHEDAMECSALRFVELVQALVELHGLGVVHGDIRLANVVLEGKKAYLIDFDFAGKAGLTFYPPGLSSLEDGGRHEDVENAIQQRNIDKLALEFEHDWSSLVFVMKLFTATKEIDSEKWGKLISLVTEKPHELVDMEESSLHYFDFNVRCATSSFEGQGATGSPIKAEAANLNQNSSLIWESSKSVVRNLPPRHGKS